MRVISGKLKGVVIPFVNDKFDDANATPQKIKKALFSILGEDLTGKSFLDLYACSGQVGIEALSRGAEMVVFNEIDHKRFQFIRSFVNKLELDASSLVLNFHAFRCMRYLDSKGYKFDSIFIDAPYFHTGKSEEQYNSILRELRKYDILKEKGIIVIQHRSKIQLDTNSTDYGCIATKKYAKNSLTIIELIRDKSS